MYKIKIGIIGNLFNRISIILEVNFFFMIIDDIFILSIPINNK